MAKGLVLTLNNRKNLSAPTMPPDYFALNKSAAPSIRLQPSHKTSYLEFDARFPVETSLHHRRLGTDSGGAWTRKTNRDYYFLGELPYLNNAESVAYEGVTLIILVVHTLFPILYGGGRLYWKSHFNKLKLISSISLQLPYILFHLGFHLILGDLRNSLAVMPGMLYTYLNVLALWLLFLLFSSWLAYVIFEDTQQGTRVFMSYLSTLYHMFVLFTTSNNLDVWIPAYKSSRWYSIFFILYEHVLSERKRREKLAQRFMSLSDLLPGRKKMDKATVLEDASNYIIQLQTRVKELEERSVKGKDIMRESVVSFRRSMFCVNPGDQASCSDETYKDLPSSSTYDPEIKARISGRNILLRIYCGEHSSIMMKTLIEMERLHITHICCSVLPLSNTAHVITITAKMNEEMVITTKYLGKCLQSALSNFPLHVLILKIYVSSFSLNDTKIVSSFSLNDTKIADILNPNGNSTSQ
ncbi:hypothetical protein LXL04_013660 [Taraxacum kok-saghyz]